MKQTLMTVMMLIFVSTASYGQTGAFATDCPTIEQQQAAYNQQKANSIAVVNTASQQLQCYYQQLATYYQQLHKTNQQLAKDKQQIEKDIQQKAKDAQQIAYDLTLKARESFLTEKEKECYDLKLLVQELKLIIEHEECDCEVSLKLKAHFNHSGGADGTNPGGGGNLDGYLNPHN